MRFLLIATLMLSFTAYAQEESSREFADGVIELTTVKVKTNFLQDYLDGIEKTWVAAAKIQKRWELFQTITFTLAMMVLLYI